MSTTSNATTVTYNGTEMPLDQAIDDVFGLIQNNVNYCHSTIRQIGMSQERDEDYLVVGEFNWRLSCYVDELNSLFKDLKKISKSVLGTCPPELKVEYQQMLDRLKREREASIQREKQLEESQKNKMEE